MLTAVPLLIIAAPVVAQDCEWPVRDPDDQATYGCVRRFDDYPVKINQKDIVVTGALAETKSDSSYPISQITLGGNITRIENALAQAAGLQQFRRSDARSANPTSQGITLRGLGGNASSRAQLLLDDVPQADPFGGWISWPGYDTLQLASVRIRRGAGQVAAGTGALAGVVELDSLQNMDRITGAAYFGSRNSADAKAAILQSLGAGSISVSGSFTRGDGFIPIKEGQRGAVDRPAAYEQGGIAIRAVAPLSANTELQANMRAFTDDRDRGFDFSDNQNSGVDASLRVVNRTPGGWQWSALGYVQVRQFANRFGAIGAGRNSVSLTLDQFSVPSTGLGTRIEVRPPLGDSAELRVGADWRRTVGETNENFFFTGLTPGRNRRAGGGSDTVGLFTEASLDLTDMLTLTAGARADHWRIADGFRKEVNIGGSVRSDDRFSDRSGWEGTGRAGIVWRSTDIFKVRGAAYLAWRLPTLNELYRPFRVGADATAANELLAPERLRGAEIGADFEKGGVTLSGTIFANRLNNAIANVGLSNGPGNFPGVGFVGAGGVFRQRRNLDAIDSKGLEIEAAYTVNLFWVRASYAFVDAQVKASGNAALLDGLRPAQVPRHFANLGIGYDGAKVRADLSGRFVSGQFEDDVNSRHLGGAFTIDGGLHYRLGTKIELELRGENLFDAQVDAAIAADGVIERAMPRTIWVGIALDF
ncbi:TonB-dependent receptor [Sphingorhabdus sp. IMCC26285]|uniref:TonB-dependent receptor n=1 Tax=Sphingorhabdus profundilacus TaxID=2509718 RepID=A0A6I4LZM0_9SPHN|nr:TonB-dependent receptor [Sphingorhabdus profundilacus]MVZ97374.1 TonB-dependent receptor [Sphingorhabdus profundilacus]